MKTSPGRKGRATRTAAAKNGSQRRRFGSPPKISGSALSCFGSGCYTRANAIPVFSGRLCSNSENASSPFYRMFDVTAPETEGSSIYELGNGQWNVI
jgi:hypothetical protein